MIQELIAAFHEQEKRIGRKSIFFVLPGPKIPTQLQGVLATKRGIYPTGQMWRDSNKICENI